MFDVQSRWRPWAGAGAAAVLAELADARQAPLTSTLTNGELVALAAVTADAFGMGGPRWGSYVQGSGSWGAGALIGSLARSRITPSTATTAPKVSGGTPASTATAAPPTAVTGMDEYIPAVSYGVSADGGY